MSSTAAGQERLQAAFVLALQQIAEKFCVPRERSGGTAAIASPSSSVRAYTTGNGIVFVGDEELGPAEPAMLHATHVLIMQHMNGSNFSPVLADLDRYLVTGASTIESQSHSPARKFVYPKVLYEGIVARALRILSSEGAEVS